MTTSPTRSGSIANVRMTLMVFRRAGPPRLPYTISVFGSTSNLAGLVWPLQTWWTGKLTLFHTKRLSPQTFRIKEDTDMRDACCTIQYIIGARAACATLAL